MVLHQKFQVTKNMTDFYLIHRANTKITTLQSIFSNPNTWLITKQISVDVSLNTQIFYKNTPFSQNKNYSKHYKSTLYSKIFYTNPGFPRPLQFLSPHTTLVPLLYKPVHLSVPLLNDQNSLTELFHPSSQSPYQ